MFSDELSVFHRAPVPRPLSFIRLLFLFFCSGLSSCHPSIFLSSLSSGNRDYLGASRHSISPGGKVTHSALQLAPDSCRLKLEVPSILTATLTDSEPLSATQPKALCATSYSSRMSSRADGATATLGLEKETVRPCPSCLSLNSFKYISITLPAIYPKADSLFAPVLLLISSNVSLCGPLRFNILKKPGSRLNGGMIDFQCSKGEKLWFHSAMLF